MRLLHQSVEVKKQIIYPQLQFGNVISIHVRFETAIYSSTSVLLYGWRAFFFNIKSWILVSTLTKFERARTTYRGRACSLQLAGGAYESVLTFKQNSSLCHNIPTMPSIELFWYWCNRVCNRVPFQWIRRPSGKLLSLPTRNFYSATFLGNEQNQVQMNVNSDPAFSEDENHEDNSF